MSAEFTGGKSDFPCPFNDGAKCNTECANHSFLLSISKAASLYRGEKGVSGERVSEEEVQNFVQKAIKEGIYESRLKPADCSPEG